MTMMSVFTNRNTTPNPAKARSISMIEDDTAV
jgi:hypothetical protein